MTPITPEEIEALRGLADDSGDAATCRWADALADKIEAMQAENTALKQRIEESARVWVWIWNDESRKFELKPNGKGSPVAIVDGDTDVANAVLLSHGLIRPIDTIIRPEGM